MTVFRLVHISDSHLSRRLPPFTENFQRLSEYIDSTRPDLVVNSGDLGFDGYAHHDDLEFAREQHDALAVGCRFLPGNHDIGDNPTLVGAPPPQRAAEAKRQTFLSIFGEDHWRFDAGGWRFIGLN
jgi:3',5'-cyclic AMP phosphodiesterase CpdA